MSAGFLLSRLMLWGAIVGLAALATLAFGMLASPLLAVGLPIVVFGGLLLLAEPFLGLSMLVFFGHLDALEKLLFGFLPLSAFKLITAGTVSAVLLTAVRWRDDIAYTLRDPTAVFAILFCVLFAVSGLFATDRGLANEALQKTVSFVILLLMIVILTNSRGKLEVLLWMLVVTSVLSALILIADTVLGVQLVAQSDAATTAQTSEGVVRSSGASDYNPTTAASMLLVGVTFALTHVLETPRLRLLLLGAVAVGSMALVFSFARSSALAYVVIVLALAMRYRRERWIALAAFAAIAAGLAAVPFIPAEYWDRIASIFGGGADWTLNRRMSYNLIGLDLIGSHPLLGVGPGNFPAHFADQEYRYLPGRTLIGRELHNMYLSVLVQAGFIGGMVFAAMYVFALRSVRAVMRSPASEEMRILAVCLMYGVVAYLIASLFLPNEYTKYTWILAGLCAAIYRVNEIEKVRLA